MKAKVMVAAVHEGKFAYDSIAVVLRGRRTQICFPKSEQVAQYLGKHIYLYKDSKGHYSIEPIAEEPAEIE